MEIQTPQTIWKDYDKSGATNETVVSTVDHGDYLESCVYFNGEKADDGIARICAQLFLPKKDGPVPAVLFFDDEKNHLGITHVSALLEEGLAVLVVDYVGKLPGKSRYTLYPDSLNPQTKEEFPEDMRQSRTYIYGCVGFKALNYLLSKDFVDKDRIGVLGAGEAGAIVWTLSVKEKLKAGMTFYGGGFFRDEKHDDLKFLAYKAAFDVRSCAQHSLFPVLIQGTSNERNSSLDYLNELYNCSDKNYFSIAPRANRSIITPQKKNIKYWFAYMLADRGYAPIPPTINARESDGKLYYDLEVDVNNEVTFVKLYTYQGEDEAAFRNWSEQKIVKISEGKYISKVDVYTENEPIRAFVTVKYKHSLYLCSPVLLKRPKQMKVLADPRTSRLIYESDMGLDDFIVPNDYDLNHDEEKLVMKKGPHDIEGVCSMTGQLMTFKLGDHKYRGQGETLLKILLYVEQKCNVTFTVMDRSRDVFEFVKTFEPEDGWASVSLASFDFKSQKRVLSDWSEIVSIRIYSGDAKLLLGSMLWV